MKTLKRLSGKLLAAVTVVVLLLGAASGLVAAQSGGGFDLSWSTVDGGGFWGGVVSPQHPTHFEEQLVAQTISHVLKSPGLDQGGRDSF